MNQERQAIWIDLDNSPHVPLFAPIVKHYREAGVEVIITARDHSQTIELIKQKDIGDFAVIGRHYGKRKLNKIRGLLIRARQLASHIKLRSVKPSVAISHGSRSMVLAAKWLRIPVVTMYDYEFNETTIFNRLSDKVIVPDRIPDRVLVEMRLSKNKCQKYPGIKEELYVRSFDPTPDFRAKFLAGHNCQHARDNTLAVVRPPATTANYHSEKSEYLFDDVLHLLLNAPNVFTVIVPRTDGQKTAIRARIENMPNVLPRVLILEEAVNGLDLAFAADLLISGGGTMNREAVLLGMPVYSIFAGPQGALDRQMESDGLITFIRDVRDLSKIRLERREPQAPNTLTDRVERFVIDQIDSFLTKN